MKRNEAVWITWEHHRRTEELALALGISVLIVKRAGRPLLNPWLPLIRTFVLLLRLRHRVIFVQNPSLLLTVAACLVKPFKKFRVIQDLHSYFAQHVEYPRTFRGRVYKL